MAVTLTHPFPGAIVTTRFGAPNAINGAPHTGVDFAYSGGSCNRKVLAAAPGIAHRRENVGGGHGIEIEHGAGIVTGYWHLNAQLVSEGQKVQTGQLIGLAGASGSMVTGCHLHFELKLEGRNVDPLPYVGNRTVVPSGTPDSFPIDAGESCPAGYVMGRVNPRVHGAIPGSPWWNRPVDANGTALACIRSGLQPGDNTALTDVGQGALEALGFVVPILSNLFVIALALILGWSGVKQVLGIGAGAPIVVLPGRR